LTPFYRKSSNAWENTKDLNYEFNSPRSLTRRITQLNKVCHIPKERLMEFEKT
jgi:hypothetical protein